MADAHKNLAVSTVATAPSPATSGTSLVVASGHGSRFPTAPFNATVWPAGAQPDPANAEIVRVTVVSTDTLTITRTQESTSARSITVGDQIAATITALTLTDVEGVAAGAVVKSLVDAKGDLYVGTADNTVARKAAGSNSQVLSAQSGQTDGLLWVYPPTDLIYSIGKELAVEADVFRWYNKTGRTLTVTKCWVSMGTAPTGASAIFDVNKNGTTLFSTQGNRPTISASGFLSTTTLPDVTSVADGDYLTFDVDQIGSTIKGSYAVFTVVMDG